jgi:CRISPR/Cas system-associated exonuclease Cas4 (RecB family)
MKQKILSKSRLMRGLQCEKNLWLNLHKPELEPKADAATQMQFDEGNEVGELARKLAGKGTLIDTPHFEYQKAYDTTQLAIKSGDKLIFEAAFLFEDLFARADILKKDKNGWHLIEVKKSTSVKDYHITDSAIQTYIIESAGLKIKSTSIRFISNEVVYPDVEDIFETRDVTGLVRTFMDKALEKQLSELRTAIDTKKEPKIKIGEHCGDPFDCPFKSYCWKDVPEKSVFDLPILRSDKKWSLFNAGKKSIADLDAADYTKLTRRAIEVTQSSKLFVDPKAISKRLADWAYPFYFFDFETISPAIPRYKDTKPYSQIPFQFSCHVQKSAASKKLDHFEYLHTKSTDPRPELIKAILDGLQTEGSIVAYNKSFEIGVIKKLAEFDKKNGSSGFLMQGGDLIYHSKIGWPFGSF